MLSSSTTKLMSAVLVSEFITAPAAFTLSASVTSALLSIPLSFVCSASVKAFVLALFSYAILISASV